MPIYNLYNTCYQLLDLDHLLTGLLFNVQRRVTCLMCRQSYGFSTAQLSEKKMMISSDQLLQQECRGHGNRMTGECTRCRLSLPVSLQDNHVGVGIYLLLLLHQTAFQLIGKRIHCNIFVIHHSTEIELNTNWPDSLTCSV